MQRMSQSSFEQELGHTLEGVRRYHPLRVILFGSFARGDYHAASDVDLVIIKDTDRPFVERIGDVPALCNYAIPLEPLVYTPQEIEQMILRNNPFIEQVLREGKVIYES
ncbi:MAG: hypothetical protein CVU38_07130 [Chloroflexi bacterium HGW-Chloroflexi-1]|nr:MAG: hypothetical protein CVU38_07130 [Chloroflexi bacterium HGW-Chloroflexi-1]